MAVEIGPTVLDHTDSAGPISMEETQLFLAQLHLDRGDEAQAFEMFAVAARSGSPRALNMLGRAYACGWGVPTDHRQAERCFLLASEGGEGWADFNLGDLYLAASSAGHGAEQAFDAYVRAARRGVGKALNMLGVLHERGIGTCCDPAAAALYFNAGAEQGDCWAFFNLGRQHLEHGAVNDAVRLFAASLPHGFEDYWHAVTRILGALDEREAWRPLHDIAEQARCLMESARRAGDGIPERKLAERMR